MGEAIVRLGMWVFLYCTDFVINLANLTGLSYYEINFFLFLVIWPLLTFVLLLFYGFQHMRWVILKSRTGLR